MSKLSNKESHLKDIPIRTIFFISFVIILLSTVIAIEYITYSSWMNSVNDIITKTANDINQQIINKIDIVTKGAKQLNIVNKELIETGIIDINSELGREIPFVNALTSSDAEAVYSISYGTELGEYYGARKNEDNIMEIMRNNKMTGGHTWYYSATKDKIAGEFVLDAGEFDPRTRAWYKAAKETKGMVFSPIYKHFLLDDLAISSAAPIYSKDGELQGVLSSHMNLSRINNYLEEIVSDENAHVVIVEKKSGELVANSLNIVNFKTNADGDFGRISINEIGNEAIQQAYNSYINSSIDNYQIDYKNDKLYLKLIEYHDEGLDWIIITALSNGPIVSSIREDIIIALKLTILAVCISSLVFLILTRKYMDPISNLIKTQEKFASGNLLERAIVVRNDELGMVSNSFNTMADTIYELINSLEEKVEERTLEINMSNQALTESKNQLQLILNSTAEAIYGMDLDGNCTFINASGVDILGYNDKSELIGKDMHIQIHHSYKNGIPIPIKQCNILNAVTKRNHTYSDHEVFWKKDGTWFSVEYHGYPQILDGKIVGAVITFRDNTDRKLMEEMLFNEKEHFRTTLLSVGDGVISTDSQGVVTIMNPVAEKLTGWSKQEAYGKPLEEVLVIIDELTQQIRSDSAKRVLESGKTIEIDNHTMLMSKTKDMIPIEDSAAPIRDKDGNISGVVIILRDVTDKREKLSKIEYLSIHDQLTGLYNRWYMEDAMNRLDTKRNYPFAIMIIDVNGLKLVNDAFGHKVGDELLEAVSKILKDALRAEDIIGRVGGDEFLILLPQTDEVQADKIKKRIKKLTSLERFDSIIISVAIGYAVKKDIDENFKDIMISADNQIYKDKLTHGKTMRSQTIDRILRNINNKYDKEQIHTERVSYYCESIAMAMGFSEKEVKDIKTVAVLHDIGKIIVPPELLYNDKELTNEEFDLIKKHPQTGYQILKSVDEYAALAEDVLYHHEYWNGEGYPHGLKGEKIPLNSRIIGIVDAYEAMTAKRTYKRMKSKQEAIAELKRCAGTQFDPDIVKVFVEKVLSR